MPAKPTFTFVCGQDDYLVSRMAQKRFQALATEVTDEFSRETILAFAGNVDEVQTAVNRIRESVQTIPMFGGKRVVWMKDVNFLGETVTGRAESTLKAVEDLQQILQSVNPDDTAVIVSAAPVDRRRSFPKWCEKNSEFILADGDKDGVNLAEVVASEAKECEAKFGPGAVELLLARVGANTRFLVEEVRKLATHAGDQPISEKDVAELTPNIAEGEFFETADAFFSGDLDWTLAALHRHFFTGGDARPVIAALQNRNRILLQLRALVDAGEVHLGPRGVDGLQRAAGIHRDRFAEAFAEKSAYNVFTQNPWYLGKLAGAKLPSLRRLIDNQRDFVAAFEEIIRRSDEQEEVLRDLAVRCLAG